MAKTWIGSRCANCGLVTPLIATGREVEAGSAITSEEQAELNRLCTEGVKCPQCQTDLRYGVTAPAEAPDG